MNLSVTVLVGDRAGVSSERLHTNDPRRSTRVEARDKRVLIEFFQADQRTSPKFIATTPFFGTGFLRNRECST